MACGQHYLAQIHSRLYGGQRGRDGVKGWVRGWKDREREVEKDGKILFTINGKVIDEECKEERKGQSESVECSAAVLCRSYVPYKSLPSTNSFISLSRPTTQSSTLRSRIILREGVVEERGRRGEGEE